MKELRKSPRVQDRNIVSVTIGGAPDASGLSGEQFFCFSEDISVCGLSFSAHTAPPVGAMLKLNVAFSTPRRSVTNLVGRVTWVQQIPCAARHVIGVDLSGSSTTALEKWHKIVVERILG